MAKFQNFILLRNSKGQSAVEYILLLAVLSSLGYTFYNNKRFKDFIGGNQGFFVTLRKGMAYSYRYGREYTNDIDYEEAVGFSYQSNKHDTYLNSEKGSSRFFAGQEKYGK